MKKGIFLVLTLVLLIEPIQRVIANNSNGAYVVTNIKDHDEKVAIIDVERNDSVFRIYSIIREPIDSTYNKLNIGDTIRIELVSLQEKYKEFEQKFNIMPNLGVVNVFYPGIYISHVPPRNIVGEYICSRLNGKYIKND